MQHSSQEDCLSQSTMDVFTRMASSDAHELRASTSVPELAACCLTSADLQMLRHSATRVYTATVASN